MQPASSADDNLARSGGFHFADALLERVNRLGNPCVVGLDPDLGRIPAAWRGARGSETSSAAGALAEYCLRVIDAVSDLVPAVKPQSAYFELYGSAGIQALERVVAHARACGLLVIMDGKRGDIGSTSEAYAAAYLRRSPPGPLAADALTLSPYLGIDSLEPFVARSREEGAGVFVCVKTSNPGSRDFQDLRLATGERLYERVAAAVSQWARTTIGACGYGNVGAVVGATFPEAVRALRLAMPQALLLVPGLGAQGGAVAALRDAFDEHGRGALLNSSRAVMYPAGIETGHDLEGHIRSAALRFIDEARGVLGT